MAVAPNPINAAHLNPRRAPSLRIVRLIGPTGMDNSKPKINPVRAATSMGGRLSSISIGVRRRGGEHPPGKARPGPPAGFLQNLVPRGHALCGTRAIFVIVFFLNFSAHSPRDSRPNEAVDQVKREERGKYVIKHALPQDEHET